MSLFSLALREIAHGKTSYLCMTLSVMVAVGALTGVLGLLERFDDDTQVLLDGMADDLDARVTRINDNIRKAMLKLGHNILILPAEQNLGDFYAGDYAGAFMPAAWLEKLSAADLKTMEHLIPAIRRKALWPEKRWTVRLIGLGDRVVQASAHASEIPFVPVPAGQVDLGFEIHRAREFQYAPGDSLVFMGKTFRVRHCSPERGTKDDITLWFQLADLQTLLDKQDLISEVRALETAAAWSDVAAVREEISRILPGVKIIEIVDKATPNAQARKSALTEGEAAIRTARKNRADLMRTRKRLAWIFIPMVLLICTGWLGMMMLRNVQARTMEVGVLLSVGYTSRQVMALFLIRSVSLALAGGLAGFLGGGIIGSFRPAMLGLSLLTAAVITGAAVLGPLVRAARQDPADILRPE